MSKDRHAFLDALRANPYDKELRLVYADWLEENGFDDEALEQREWNEEKQKSEDWLRNVAKRLQISYAKLLLGIHFFMDYDYWDTNSFFPKGESPLTVVPDMLEFFRHFAIVTGREYGRRYEAGREDANYDEYDRCPC